MPNTLIKKYAPLNVSKVTMPSSDRMFYTAGGKRDYPLWQVVNEYGSSYYSGLDVSVYFGDIFVDEIVQISYSETENVRPLFAYASWVFDAVAHGSRIVQGSFAVNFKDAGYIPTMLSHLASRDPAESLRDVSIAQIENTAREAAKATDTNIRDDYLLANRLLTDSYNQAKDWPTQLAISRDLTIEDIINSTGGDEGYQRAMDRLKKQHWGQYESGTQKEDADAQFRRPKYVIRTGPMAPGFDVVVKYGQPEDYYDHRPGWGTIECIKDCHITGFQKAIDDSGRNVLEVYNFLAKSII